MNEIHLYRRRHLFHADECIGKYDAQRDTAFLLPQFSGFEDCVRAYFAYTEGSPLAAVVIGDASLAAAVLPRKFPPEIVALMDWRLGARTPAVIAYAQANFTKDEFDLIYRNSPPWQGPAGQAAAPLEVAVEGAREAPPARRGRPAKNPPSTAR
jgi:hypothetical protein